MDNFKICTITHHTVPNYGAILQAYALQKKLDKLGVQNEILNYKSLRVERTYYRSFKLCTSWKQKILYCLNHRSRKRYKKFDDFVNEYLKVSKEYKREELAITNDEYDLFITGSDQVWNLNIHQGDTSYMLDFVSDSSKKGSYAASFGYSSVPEQYKKITYEYLSKINYFLLREETGKNILNDLNINKSAQVVLDPTLLLDKEDYQKIVTPMNEDYILVYDLINSEELKSFAKELSKKEHLKIKCINVSRKKEKGMYNEYFAGPKEFLSLIANAKYIVTSSYHGIIFSMIFEKNFYYGLNKNKANNNSRIQDLAEKLNFEERNIETTKEITDIDYCNINKKINLLKEESESALINMIEKAKQK